MILEDPINRLAELFGIEANASIDNKIQLLKAQGVLSKDFNAYDKDSVYNNAMFLKDKIDKQVDSEYVNVVHQVSILRQNRVNELVISLPEGVDVVNWTLFEEDKVPYHDEVSLTSLEPFQEHNQDCVREIDGINYRKYKFSFPFEINLGYHNIEFSFDNPEDGRRVIHKSRLIAAPEKCYDGLQIRDGKKTWGVPVQLYEQVSENNLGIGNFSDLAQIGNILGKNGAGILGVNPLHAMRDDQPENASPYEPDSRMFFNYIYLDVTAIPEFKNNLDIRSHYHSPEFQQKVEHNRRKAHVDYALTQELVDDIIWRCFYKFTDNKKSEDYKRFCVFCDTHGDDLEKYATFRALCRHMSQQNPAPINWRQWPEEYRNPKSETVTKFRQENREWINFYKYSQWQCHHQMENVQKTCLSSGMKIGLYTDNAVGCSCRGFEAWNYPDLYLKASAGAPPDVLSQSGQNWNILGFNPIKLRESGYEPYRKIIHNNMQYAGCTRIDHVLQLQRLYMIPEGKSPQDGAFIHYNSDELMAIVALESHRHKTMVIGEDLGMIPDGFRPKLEDFGILSYRVLPFEREWGFLSGHGTNAMKHPNEYPTTSVCSTSTHDTPTLVNQWNVQDVYQKQKFGLIDQQQANEKFEQYATQREALNYALYEKGSWERVGGKACNAPRQDAAKLPDKYIQAVADYMGQSNSAIMLMPFSDIFGTKEMGNIPGTKEVSFSEKKAILEIPTEKAYPNWRKKMHIPVEHIDKVPILKEVAGILNHYRPHGNNGKGHYYQFTRMGEQKETVVDFDRYLRLYEHINEDEKFSQENIIKNRYSLTRCAYLDKRTQETKNHYDSQQRKYDSFKTAIQSQRLVNSN